MATKILGGLKYRHNNHSGNKSHLNLTYCRDDGRSEIKGGPEVEPILRDKLVVILETAGPM